MEEQEVVEVDNIETEKDNACNGTVED